jgi:hypothetical protein
MGAYTNELLDSGKPSQHYIIPYSDMTRKSGIVGEDTVIAYFTVVGYVRVGHYKAVIAYGSAVPVSGTPVYGNAFAYGSIVTYYSQRVLTLKLQVLRYGRNNRAWKDPAVLTDPRTLHYGNVRTYPGAFSDLYILVNGGKRVNLDVRPYLGVRVDIRKRVDHFLSFLII